ncbi:MAG: carbohydrate kinase family protein [Nitrososphaerales archaeon]
MDSKTLSRIEEHILHLPSLGKISVMPDYFVDRFVRIDSLNDLVAKMKRRGIEGGGGSVRGIRQTELKGGNAVNIGYALGVLGANVNLIAIADSFAADMLRSTFRKLPNVDLQIVNGKPGYTTAFEFEERNRHVNVMISDVGHLANFGGTELSQRNLKSIAQSEIVAVVNWSANRKGNNLCKKVFSLAKKNGAKTLFDPADVSSQKHLLPELKRSVFDEGLVDFISLNENEARIISGILFNYKLPRVHSVVELKKTAKILSEGTGSTVDLHTRDLSISASGNEVISKACYRIRQKTVTGAGDVWAAADIVGYLTAMSIEDRLSFANSAAGLYVSRESAATPSLSELLGFMEANRNH